METAAPPSQLGDRIAKTGAWLQLTPFIMLGFIALMMIKAVNILRDHDVADPQKLSEALGLVLTFTFVALSLSLLGLVLVAIAITIFRYRARWMFQFLCFYGLLVIGLNLCLLVLGYFHLGLHLLFAVFFLIFAVKKKDEFVDAAEGCSAFLLRTG